MSEAANQVLIPDVSMKLEHMRHYLELADEQHNRQYILVDNDEDRDIHNRIGWLLDDVLIMLAEVAQTLYPAVEITTTTQGE